MRALATLSRRLAADRSGLALIEFAYSLPILLVCGLGGLESANLVIAHMKISRIASMTADNASRVRDSIDETDINELMQGAQIASGALDLKSNGRVILSDLQQNSAGNGQWIRWQRCFGAKAVQSSYGRAGDGRTDNSLKAMGPAGRQVAAISGSTVMFVEVVYDYKPMITNLFGRGANSTIRYSSAFNVRKRPNGDPTNASVLPASSIASC